MKISHAEHVQYTKNPLAEVICQVQFQPVDAFDNGLPPKLTSYLNQNGFIEVSEEQSFSIALALASDAPAGAQLTPQQIPTAKVYHVTSGNGLWKASIAPTFFAVSCVKYESWPDFRPRLVNLSDKIFSIVGSVFATRIGLRYKDVIEREALGLEGVPWHELISPFLLGPMSLHSLSEDEVVEDSAFGNFISQSTLALDDCSLLLQSTVLTTPDQSRRAFLIDSDFYVEAKDSTALYQDNNELIQKLEALHNNASSLFRRSITEKLHEALGPTRISV